MPRSTPDEGVKPFEFRVGIGGMPRLGGMYRAGDPATIPPHKHHLLINVRITPGGMTNRPGLTLEHDTGVEECIDGLTETGEPGATMLLWPGATQGTNGAGAILNGATFRLIRPNALNNASEYEFVAYEAPATVVGSQTIILQPADATIPPFFFRGKLCLFYDESPVWRVIELALPKESGLTANDCRRTTTWGTDAFCPATPNLAGTLWPRGEPFGASLLITDFPAAYPSTDWTIESFFVDNERDDDPLTADVGIHEFLYVLLFKTSTGDRTLLRYTGSTWLVEYTLPNGLLDNVALGPGRYGPILVASSATSDWSAYRNAAGSWVAIDGTSDEFTTGVDAPWTNVSMNNRGIAIDGEHGVVVFATRTLGAVTAASGVYVLEQDSLVSNRIEAGRCVYEVEQSITGTLVAWKQSSGFVYALVEDNDNWQIVSDAYTGGDNCGGAVALSPSSVGPIWLQEIGGRILVGGKFDNYDVPTQAADLLGLRHAVYDVTDQVGILTLYEVFAAEQPEDFETARYSYGCLPAFPQQNEDTEF